MALSLPTFSDKEYDYLSPNLEAVDWVLELERLTKTQEGLEREVRDTRLGRKPSNGEIFLAMLDILITGTRVRGDEERMAQLTAIVKGIEDALLHDNYARKCKLDKIGPELIELYRFHDRTQLDADLKALNRPDDSKETDAKIASLEAKIERSKEKIEAHRATVLTCFKGNKLPKASAITAYSVGLDVGWPDSKLGEYLIQKFARDWRMRAPLFEKPVSAHGVLIASMSSHRRDLWQCAYDKLGLGELKKQVRFAPRMEPRPTMVIPASKGEFFSATNKGREAVSTR